MAGSVSAQATGASSETTAASPQSAAEAVRAIESTLLEIQSRYVERAEKTKSFEIDEAGANQYLRHRARTDLKDGISNPWIRLEKGMAILGARLDLETLKQDMPDNLMLSLLRGVVPVEIEAKLESKDGEGNIRLERVSVSGIELPTSFVEDLARQHGTASYLPPGFRLGESFPLPYDLEAIRLSPRLIRIDQRGSPRQSGR